MILIFIIFMLSTKKIGQRDLAWGFPIWEIMVAITADLLKFQ